MASLELLLEKTKLTQSARIGNEYNSPLPFIGQRGFCCLSDFDFCIAVLYLCKRGMIIIIPHNIRIENLTVFLRHFQRGMAQQLLQRESVAAAIQQIFSSEGVTEKMDRRFLHAPRTVVAPYCVAQTAFGHLLVIFIRKQKIIVISFSDFQIFLQDHPHFRA